MSEETGVAVPLVSAKPGRWRSLFVPLMAMGAMLLALGLTLGLIATNSAAIARNCVTNARFYNTFVQVINHVENPPVVINAPLTAQEHHQLHLYADNLRSALPAKPTC